MVESTKQLGKIEFDPETRLYRAEILTLSAMETFQIEDINELRRLMRAAGNKQKETRPSPALRPPEPTPDCIFLNLGPALYLQLSRQAGRANKNLNDYIIDILQEAVDHALFLEHA